MKPFTHSKVLCGPNAIDFKYVIYVVSIVRRHQIVANRELKERSFFKTRLKIELTIRVFWGLISAFEYESHNLVF